MKKRRSRSTRQPSPPDGATDRNRGNGCEPDTVSSGTLLALLGDEYVRELLTLLVERPQTGRELAATTEMSRPTIYRRLERLREHGLVRTEMQIDLDGHHRKRFHPTVGRLDFEVGPDGIDASAENTADDRS
ncbi:ArsR/SmtB family transcription factor [Halorhabdus rudnickae]|uniref:ArsR/SmtB family transcription factor n=1 Tax=Halorhabdus rudnickae TaxID=1775544 RepID=UPI00143848BB|nr:winged helix-turn-helix domain-containing protein [Halorhabdus rudnickae]